MDKMLHYVDSLGQMVRTLGKRQDSFFTHTENALASIGKSLERQGSDVSLSYEELLRGARSIESVLVSNFIKIGVYLDDAVDLLKRMVRVWDESSFKEFVDGQVGRESKIEGALDSAQQELEKVAKAEKKTSAGVGAVEDAVTSVGKKVAASTSGVQDSVEDLGDKVSKDFRDFGKEFNSNFKKDRQSLLDSAQSFFRGLLDTFQTIKVSMLQSGKGEEVLSTLPELQQEIRDSINVTQEQWGRVQRPLLAMYHEIARASGYKVDQLEFFKGVEALVDSGVKYTDMIDASGRLTEEFKSLVQYTVMLEELTGVKLPDAGKEFMNMLLRSDISSEGVLSQFTKGVSYLMKVMPGFGKAEVTHLYDTFGSSEFIAATKDLSNQQYKDFMTSYVSVYGSLQSVSGGDAIAKEFMSFIMKPLTETDWGAYESAAFSAGIATADINVIRDLKEALSAGNFIEAADKYIEAMQVLQGSSAGQEIFKKLFGMEIEAAKLLDVSMENGRKTADVVRERIKGMFADMQGTITVGDVVLGEEVKAKGLWQLVKSITWEPLSKMFSTWLTNQWGIRSVIDEWNMLGISLNDVIMLFASLSIAVDLFQNKGLRSLGKGLMYIPAILAKGLGKLTKLGFAKLFGKFFGKKGVIGDVADAVGGSAGGVTDGIAGATSSIGQKVMGFLAGLGKTVYGFFEGLFSLLGKLGQGIGTFIEGVFKGIANAISSFASVPMIAVGKFALIAGIFTGVVLGLGYAMNLAAPLFTAVADVFTSIGGIVSTFANVIYKLMDIARMGPEVSSGMGQLMNSFSIFTQALGTFLLSSGVAGILFSVSTKAGADRVVKFLDFYVGLVERIAGIAVRIRKYSKEGVLDVFSSIVKLIENLNTGIKNISELSSVLAISNFMKLDDLIPDIQAVVGILSDFYERGLGSFINFLELVKDEDTDALKVKSDSFVSILSVMNEGLKGIKGITDSFLGASAIDKIISAVSCFGGGAESRANALKVLFESGTGSLSQLYQSGAVSFANFVNGIDLKDGEIVGFEVKWKAFVDVITNLNTGLASLSDLSTVVLGRDAWSRLFTNAANLTAGSLFMRESIMALGMFYKIVIESVTEFLSVTAGLGAADEVAFKTRMEAVLDLLTRLPEMLSPLQEFLVSADYYKLQAFVGIGSVTFEKSLSPTFTANFSGALKALSAFYDQSFGLVSSFLSNTQSVPVGEFASRMESIVAVLSSVGGTGTAYVNALGSFSDSMVATLNDQGKITNFLRSLNSVLGMAQSFLRDSIDMVLEISMDSRIDTLPAGSISRVVQIAEVINSLAGVVTSVADVSDAMAKFNAEGSKVVISGRGEPVTYGASLESFTAAISDVLVAVKVFTSGSLRDVRSILDSLKESKLSDSEVASGISSVGSIMRAVNENLGAVVSVLQDNSTVFEGVEGSFFAENVVKVMGAISKFNSEALGSVCSFIGWSAPFSVEELDTRTAVYKTFLIDLTKSLTDLVDMVDSKKSLVMQGLLGVPIVSWTVEDTKDFSGGIESIKKFMSALQDQIVAVVTDEMWLMEIPDMDVAQKFIKSLTDAEAGVFWSLNEGMQDLDKNGRSNTVYKVPANLAGKYSDVALETNAEIIQGRLAYLQGMVSQMIGFFNGTDGEEGALALVQKLTASSNGLAGAWSELVTGYAGLDKQITEVFGVGYYKEFDQVSGQWVEKFSGGYFMRVVKGFFDNIRMISEMFTGSAVFTSSVDGSLTSAEAVQSHLDQLTGIVKGMASMLLGSGEDARGLLSLIYEMTKDSSGLSSIWNAIVSGNVNLESRMDRLFGKGLFSGNSGGGFEGTEGLVGSLVSRILGSIQSMGGLFEAAKGVLSGYVVDGKFNSLYFTDQITPVLDMLTGFLHKVFDFVDSSSLEIGKFQAEMDKLDEVMFVAAEAFGLVGIFLDPNFVGKYMVDAVGNLKGSITSDVGTADYEKLIRRLQSESGVAEVLSFVNGVSLVMSRIASGMVDVGKTLYSTYETTDGLKVFMSTNMSSESFKASYLIPFFDIMATTYDLLVHRSSGWDLSKISDFAKTDFASALINVFDTMQVVKTNKSTGGVDFSAQINSLLDLSIMVDIFADIAEKLAKLPDMISFPTISNLSSLEGVLALGNVGGGFLAGFVSGVSLASPELAAREFSASAETRHAMAHEEVLGMFKEYMDSGVLTEVSQLPPDRDLALWTISEFMKEISMSMGGTLGSDVGEIKRYEKEGVEIAKVGSKEKGTTSGGAAPITQSSVPVGGSGELMDYLRTLKGESVYGANR